MLKLLGRQTLRIISGLGDFALFTGTAFSSAVNPEGCSWIVRAAMSGAFCPFNRGRLRLQQDCGLLRPQSLRFGRHWGVDRSPGGKWHPVLAALVLVGQAGSALAAELGIQRNTEQIVALETMGVSSHGYLVAPRLIAALFVFPIQTALFVAIGLWGGSLSGSLLLGVDSGVYWSSVERAVESQDVRECFMKAATFGLLTISICAYHGFNAHRCRSETGARAVSASTTRAVVHSSIIVLAADYVITSFLV
jgi:phospholipid/cholesterol/gamma-HCH transport system permease protein